MNATPDPNMLLSQKALLRRAIRDALKQISVQEKLHQTNTVIDHLINKHDRFRRSKHIAVYLAMKHEEIDTVPLIERVLTDPQLKSQHRLYVPHIEPKSDMVFYELESLDQYNHQMNTNNKFNIKQFNDVSSLKPAREHDIDLVLVPGLGFDFDPRQEVGKTKHLIKKLTRLEYECLSRIIVQLLEWVVGRDTMIGF